MKNILLLVVIAALSGCAANQKSINSTQGEKSKLVVNISGIENEDGNIIVSVHDSEHSYKNDVGVFRTVELPAKMPDMRVIFDDIPSGKYAINVLHDENSDKKINRMILPFTGMPTESYGTSNHAYSFFSKAPFEDALVTVAPPTTSVAITISHHLKKFADESNDNSTAK